MNIKKSYYCTNIFFFLFCLLLCLASCKEEEEFLTISVSELNIPAKGEEKSIDIHTNSVWIAEVMPQFLMGNLKYNVGRCKHLFGTYYVCRK